MGQPGRLGDFRHPDLVEAPLAEQPPRRLDDGGAVLRRLLLGNLHVLTSRMAATPPETEWASLFMMDIINIGIHDGHHHKPKAGDGQWRT
ncbi:hypothetical protein ACIU1J_17580 [Azospirillum doebereinerae]|uniref:hypothetical protein n=1 Tax=Azospirillum doebereinerae TaxID=92933 RepID=UPI003851240F